MNIDFEKIKKECPKSFNEFKIYYSSKTDLVLDSIESEIIYNSCFCNFIEFFDENGIIIQISYLVREKIYCFSIIINDSIYYNINDFKIRPEAQEASIYEAFKIMEGL